MKEKEARRKKDKITIVVAGQPTPCYSAEAAAERLGCNIAALLTKARKGKMPSVLISRSVFIPASYIDEIEYSRLPVYCRKIFVDMQHTPKKYSNRFVTPPDKDFMWNFILRRERDKRKVKRLNIHAVAASRLVSFKNEDAVLVELNDEEMRVIVQRRIVTAF